MTDEPKQRALEELTEETARHIIWALSPGATSDPLTAIKQLLTSYLDHAIWLMGQIGADEETRTQHQ
jgi:hypothetical protein